MECMGHAGPVSGLAIAALVLSGCGVLSDAPGSSASSAAGGAATTVAERRAGAQDPAGGGPSVSWSPSPAFPLTMRRTGGIAGYDDTVVLRADGRILVETRTVTGRSCLLGPADQRRLLAALSTLRLDDDVTRPPADPIASADPVVPADPGDETFEPITITVTDMHARPVDLSDPSLGEVAGMVGALIGDVTLTTPATTSCGNSDPSGVVGAG